MEDQRVEMVHRDDVADALFASADAARRRTPSVQHRRRPDLAAIRTGLRRLTSSSVMGAPVELATYRDTPGWVDWYDTAESQKVLGYQNRSYQRYIGQMQAIIQAMMEE